MPRGGRRARIGLALFGLAAIPATLLILATDPLAIPAYASSAGVGVMLAVRRPANPIGWLLLLVAILLAIAGTPLPVSQAEVAAGTIEPPVLFIAWLSNAAAVAVLAVFIVIAAAFPTGSIHQGRADQLARTVVALPLAAIGLRLLAPRMNVGLADGTPVALANPIGLVPGWDGWAVAGDVVPYLVVIPCIAGAAVVVLRRFRSSQGIERQQFRCSLRR